MTIDHLNPPTGRIAENIVGFARALRVAGLPVGPGAVIDAFDALGVIEIVPSVRFYDYEAKYAPGGSKHLLPAPIPADIYELGLIYKVDIADDRKVAIDMTLTAPGCPVAGEMPGWVETAVAAVPGVQSCAVTMVFDPPWDQSRMSDEARVALDMW